MARNKTPGDGKRVGAVKARSQIKDPITGTWTKRDDRSGKFMDVKAGRKLFAGVRKAKPAPSSSEVIRQPVERRSDLMKRLAKPAAERAERKGNADRGSTIEWYYEAWWHDFDSAPPCPETAEGKHRLSIGGVVCIECGLRGRVVGEASQ